MKGLKLNSLVSVLSILCISLTSCTNSQSSIATSTHEHTYSSSYEYDDTYHWHPSTCGHDVRSGEEKHTFTSTITDPTYEQGGYTTYTCSTCGYSYVDDETDKLEHNYSSSWSYDEDSHWHACTDKGYEHLKKDESSHSFTSVVTDPTYEQGGYTTYTCSTCGYSYIDNETDALPITITWKNYDGSILEVDNNVPYGTMPTYDGNTPVKESDNLYNYYFAGWAPELEPVTKDATYTATFSGEEITYTIDFDLNGGTSPSYKGPIEVTAFSKDVFFFDCVKEDWQFRGWEYNGEKIFDEKGNQLKNVTLADDMVFKAIYSQTVKLAITTNMPEAGTITGEGEYPYNTYVDVSASPYQGYKFVGWYYQSTLLSNEEAYKYMMWDKDINLEARFEKDDFNLRIYTNNEDYGLVLLKSNSVIDDYLPEYAALREYGSEVTIAAYSKSDVRFLGWYDENNDLVTTNAVYTFVMPNHDYALEAKWNYFTINYNLNGGTNDPDNPNHYSIDDGIINLQDPTKEGYEFVGWKCNGDIIETIDVNLVQDVTLEAVWSSYECEIKEDDNGEYASIIGFDETISEVVIPESVNVNGENIIVKAIADNTFRNNDTITSVTIPSSVTTIGSSAFYYCSNLTTVTISENSQLTTIGDYAFHNCSSLTSIYIPDSVTSIRTWAFSGCSNLTAVTFGENSRLTSIGSGAFYNCSSLTSIYIPDSVTTIGSSAFDGCSNLTTATFGENTQLTSIGAYAFYYCSSLTSIYIPDSVTTIGYSAFYGCSHLTIYCEASSKPSGWDSSWNDSDRPVVWNSYLSVHDTLDGLEYAVCIDDGGNKYITIYGYAGDDADVVIPEYIEVNGEQIVVKEINDKAFYDNDTITSVIIPDSVTTIGSSAFYGCSHLTIYCEASSEPSGWSSSWNYSNRPVVWNSYKGICGDFNGLEYIAYHDNEGNPYIVITEYNGSDTDVVIPEYIEANGEQIVVKEILNSAFEDNTKITSICIPDSVTTIGSDAFYYCSNLTTVTFGENSQLASIGSYAFFGCSSLTSIYIPDSVTTIGSHAFDGCTNLTIYCEASSKPSGWDFYWNYSVRPVVWNCTYDEYLEAIA